MHEYIPEMSAEKTKVSGAKIGWHISHSLKVITHVLEALGKSEPARFKKSFNLKRFLVLTTRRIPRGKAKSPSSVLPDADLTPEGLHQQISSAREKLAALEVLPKNAFFNHPFFDHLTRDQTEEFFMIHTEHHLKIMRDILRK